MRRVTGRSERPCSSKWRLRGVATVIASSKGKDVAAPPVVGEEQPAVVGEVKVSSKING